MQHFHWGFWYQTWLAFDQNSAFARMETNTGCRAELQDVAHMSSDLMAFNDHTERFFECKNQGHYAVSGTYDRGLDSNISTLCRTIAASTNNRRISELWVYENLYLSGYRKRQDLSIVNIMW